MTDLGQAFRAAALLGALSMLAIGLALAAGGLVAADQPAIRKEWRAAFRGVAAAGAVLATCGSVLTYWVLDAAA